MKLSSAILAASLGLAWAHNDHDQHVPKLLGVRKFISGMEARRRAASGEQHTAARSQHLPTNQRRSLKGRQDDEDDDGRCGPGIGACPNGQCCSFEGWCGTGKDYCSAPDCQINYGTGCDANQKPGGADTSAVARPKLGSVQYGGAGIYDCENPGDIALTFDDGPYIYTNDLLDKLKSYGAKATFFITGTNLGKGKINDPATIYPAIIKRMHAEGHQVASHTWAHQNASQLTNQQFTDHMVWNEIALNSILGFFPTYMRPPYSICESNCQSILSTLGYHVIYFDLDTEGYLHDSTGEIQTSKNIWDDAIDAADPASDSYLQIEHDIHYQTVYNLTDYVLTSLFAAGFKAVTVGECLGDPAANWYRTGPTGGVVPSGSVAPTSTSTPPTGPTRTTISVAPTRTGVSLDGSCGNGVTCAGTQFGSCCSVFGYCGVGDDFCSVERGCQPNWGTCGNGTVPSSSVKPPTSTAKPPTSTAKPPTSTAKPPTSTAKPPTSTAKPTSSAKPPTSSAKPPTSSAKPTSFSTKTTPTTTSTPKPSQTGLPISTDGQCGPEVKQTCTGSGLGNCCSPANKCSSNTISCLAILGCQKDYGSCV